MSKSRVRFWILAKIVTILSKIWAILLLFYDQNQSKNDENVWKINFLAVLAYFHQSKGIEKWAISVIPGRIQTRISWARSKILTFCNKQLVLGLIFGLSALADEAYGFTLVRACVRHSISGDPRIRFFRNFAPSCFLARLKKCSKRIFEKNSRLPPRGGFVLKNPPF